MPTLAKLKKTLSQTAVDELDAMSKDDLRATIVRCESNIKEAEDARDNCTELTEAKLKVKEIDGPFRDAVKYQRAKQRYAALRLEESGAAAS